MALHLLLVDPEADRLAEALGALDGLDVTPVTSAAAARAYLAGTTFDAVAVHSGLDGEEDLTDLAARLGVARGVLAYTETNDLAAVLGARLGVGARTEVAPGEVRETLLSLQEEIGRVAHDLANPLAVVVGNAQLGVEMARALGADETLGQAFADIEAAGRELSDRMARLGALRARLDGLVARV